MINWVFSHKKVILIGLFLLVLVGGGVFWYQIQKIGQGVEEIVPEQVAKSITQITQVQAVDDLTDAVYVPKKGLVYVSSFDENKVYIINASDVSILEEVPMAFPNRMVLSSSGEHLYVSAEESLVLDVSADTFQVQRQAHVGRKPGAMVIDKEGRYLFVVNEFSDSVSVVSLADFTVIKNIEVGRRPKVMTINRRGDYVYVGNNTDGTLSIISTETLSEVGVVVDVGRPVALASMLNFDLVFVLDGFNGKVVVYDENLRKVTGRISTVKFPSDLIIDEANNRVITIGFTDNTIGVVDLNQEKLVNVFTLGSAFDVVAGLNNVVQLGDTARVLVTNTNTGGVFVVDLGR